MSDAAWTALSPVLIAMVTLIGAPLATAWLLPRTTFGKQARESHAMLTENGHERQKRGEKPSMIDMLSDVIAGQQRAERRLDRIDSRLEHGAGRFDHIEDVIGLPHPTDDPGRGAE